MGPAFRSSTRHLGRLRPGSAVPDRHQLIIGPPPPDHPTWRRAGPCAMRCSVCGGILANLLSGGRVSLITASGVLVLLVVGVIYPAVWSRKPERRRDAQDVIKLLFRGRDRPP